MHAGVHRTFVFGKFFGLFDVLVNEINFMFRVILMAGSFAIKKQPVTDYVVRVHAVVITIVLTLAIGKSAVLSSKSLSSAYQIKLSRSLVPKRSREFGLE